MLWPPIVRHHGKILLFPSAGVVVYVVFFPFRYHRIITYITDEEAIKKKKRRSKKRLLSCEPVCEIYVRPLMFSPQDVGWFMCDPVSVLPVTTVTTCLRVTLNRRRNRTRAHVKYFKPLLHARDKTDILSLHVIPFFRSSTRTGRIAHIHTNASARAYRCGRQWRL